MATRSWTTQDGLFHGPAWPRDNGSDFECDSPPGSPLLSSGYESIISEDLNLYDASLKVALTDEQVNALNGRLDEFEAADYEAREEIVQDFLGSFKSACSQGVVFDETTIRTLVRQHLYGKIKPATKKSIPQTRSRMAEESQEIVLTDEHISMLGRQVPKFRAADPSHRENMVEEAADNIESIWTEDVEFDRDTVINLIRQHLYGKVKRGSRKSTFENRKWTYLDVLVSMHRKIVHTLAIKLSKNAPGSPNYLSSYHKARAQVEANLTDDQRQRYKAMAKEWTEKKPPPRMQQRMMLKHGPRAIKDFTSAAYKQFGMRVVVLAAYVDGEGDPSMTLFDYNDKNGGTSFKARHENWRQHPMMEDFAKWGAESFGVSLTDGSEDETPRKRKSPEIKLKRNKDGYPVLPSLEEMDSHDLLYKKQLIGKFISDVYEISIGAGKRRVPWAKIQRAQRDYIKPKYLPKQITLKQYYHFCQKDVSAILKHWTRRQAAGKVPFCFRKAVKAIQKNNRTPEENDADADMGPGDESEDPQEDDGSQSWGERALQGDGISDGSTGQTHPDQSLGNAAENSSRPSSHSPDDDQGAARPSAAADVRAQQQTGGGVAPDLPLPHTLPPRAHSRPQPLADGSRAGQTDGPPTEDGPGGSGISRQEPPPNGETQNAADEDQQPPPGPSSAADESEEPPPGPFIAANESEEPPLALPSPTNELQRSPPASPSASAEMQGGGRRRCRNNGDAAADSPPSKRQKVDRQIDGEGLNRRRSNRDRRPTSKVAQESTTRLPNRTQSRR